jgi:acyl dehydratase
MTSGNGEPFYENLTEGGKFRSKVGRTVTEVDNMWFTLLSMDRNPIHFNLDYMQKNYSGDPFNGRLVFNGIGTMAIANGLTNEYTSAKGFILSIDGVKFKKPVFPEDTIYAEVEVVERRLSKSKPDFGIVKTVTRGFNQYGNEVIEFYKTFMVPRKNR